MNKQKILENFKKAKKRDPKLKNTKITLNFRNNSSLIMSAQPKLDFLFKKQKNRKYKITINLKKDRKFTATLTNKEIEAWIAHELGHVKQYLKLNNLQIIYLTLKYFLCSKFKRKIEIQADDYAIKMGLGKPLLTGVIKTLCSKYVKKKDKEYLRKYYTSVKDLKEKIKKHNKNAEARI